MDYCSLSAVDFQKLLKVWIVWQSGFQTFMWPPSLWIREFRLFAVNFIWRHLPCSGLMHQVVTGPIVPNFPLKEVKSSFAGERQKLILQVSVLLEKQGSQSIMGWKVKLSIHLLYPPVFNFLTETVTFVKNLWKLWETDHLLSTWSWGPWL